MRVGKGERDVAQLNQLSVYVGLAHNHGLENVEDREKQEGRYDALEAAAIEAEGCLALGNGEQQPARNHKENGYADMSQDVVKC